MLFVVIFKADLADIINMAKKAAPKTISELSNNKPKSSAAKLPTIPPSAMGGARIPSAADKLTTAINTRIAVTSWCRPALPKNILSPARVNTNKRKTNDGVPIA